MLNYFSNAPLVPVPPAGTMQATTAPAATVASVQPMTAPAATVASVPPAGTMQPTTAPGEIPQSGDLCGGTGGRGQIISIGNNEFTVKRTDDGSDQVVHLTNQATIKTSAGPAALSNLKIGYRVTPVGHPNADGSFTAYIVVVCN